MNMCCPINTMFNKQSPHPTEPTTNSKVDNIDLEMDDEKRNATHDEKALDVVDTGGMSREDYDFVQSFSPEAVAKIYRKIDWRLVPMLAILYLFSCESRYHSTAEAVLLIPHKSSIVQTLATQRSRACSSHSA